MAEGNGKIAYVNAFIDDELKESLLEKAESLGFSLRFFKSAEEALPEMGDIEILHGNGMNLVDAAPKLRWVCTPYAGVNRFDLGELKRRGILLSNSAGAYGTTISEHIIMTLIMLLRRIPEYEERKGEHLWQGGLATHTIYGSRVLVLGTGDIGRNLAKRLRAFAPAEIAGLSRSGREAEGFDKTDGIEKLDEYLPKADILIMCLPGTKETEGILSAERIELLKNGAYIVNVGRGSAIDEEALTKALESNKIAAAALDVVQDEPLPKDSPLWNTKNLYLTPHIAGQETAYITRKRIAELFMEDIENYAAGRPLKRAVDPDAGY